MGLDGKPPMEQATHEPRQRGVSRRIHEGVGRWTGLVGCLLGGTGLAVARCGARCLLGYAWQAPRTAAPASTAHRGMCRSFGYAWQVSKLRSTFTEGLLAQINPRTGRVHTRLCMASAATGRLSSVDPNLQALTLPARPLRSPPACRVPHRVPARSSGPGPGMQQRPARPAWSGTGGWAGAVIGDDVSRRWRGRLSAREQGAAGGSGPAPQGSRGRRVAAALLLKGAGGGGWQRPCSSREQGTAGGSPQAVRGGHAHRLRQRMAPA